MPYPLVRISSRSFRSITCGSCLVDVVVCEQGTVFGNRMVCLRISNNKLFARALDMVEQLGGVNRTTARMCLLRSIYGMDAVGDKEPASVERHVSAAVRVQLVVPVALVLAGAHRRGLFMPVTQARQIVAARPVRTVLGSP